MESFIIFIDCCHFKGTVGGGILYLPVYLEALPESLAKILLAVCYCLFT